MAGAVADLPQGTTVTFATTAWTANLTGIGWEGMAREMHETSHLGTAAASAGTVGNRTFIPADLSDPGSLTLEGYFDTIQTATTKQPPIDKAAESITIAWPASSGASTATWVFSGFMTDYSVTGERDGGVVTFSATVKAAGAVTITAATTS